MLGQQLDMVNNLESNATSSAPSSLRALFERIINFVAAPLLTDAEKQRSARWIRALALGFLLLATGTFIDGIIPGRDPVTFLSRGILTVSAVSVIYFIGVLVILHRGQIRLAAILLISHLWMSSTALYLPTRAFSRSASLSISHWLPWQDF